MRPTFTDKLIGELRERLIAHNERAREAGAPLVKLSQLKDVYGRNFRRKNPEVRAMQKVEGYLDDLAKAGNFDETKHPRKRGEFTTKLEASAEAHRRRQQTDAGYRALTTQIIPEHRNELEGSLVRDIGLPLLGGGAFTSVYRNRPKGVVPVLARSVGSVAGGLALGVPAGIASSLARKSPIKPITSEQSRKFTARAFKRGSVAGAKTGKFLVDRASGTLKGTVDLFSSFDHKPMMRDAAREARGQPDAGWVKAARRVLSEKAGKRLTPARIAGFKAASRIKALNLGLRGGALLGLGVPSALYVRNAVVGTPLDFARIGAGMDTFSYREVEKMVGGDMHKVDGLVAALQGGASEDDLQKALIGGFARAALPTAAGLLAGGAAAGTAHLAQRIHDRIGSKGNPNHDARGRFTHVGAGITLGTGLAGGTAAAIATVMAIRNHNTSAWRQIFDRVVQAARQREASVAEETHPDIVKAKNLKRSFVSDEVEKDRAYGEKLRDLEDKGEHGASAEYYRMHVYHAVNRKIADLMTYENEFMVKQGKVWKRLGDTPDLKVRTAAINKFLSTASAQDVEHALKHVDPAKAEIVTDLLDRRTSLVDAVEGQIAGHKAKVEAAQEKVKTATAEQANAAAAAELADLKHRSAAPEEQEALKAVLGEAKKLEAAASKRLDTATAALSKFTGKDTSPVPHPFDAGKSIKPPDTHSLANAKEVLRREAEDRAYAKWDKKLASVKQKVAAEVASSKMRYMAIASILAHNGGVRLGAAARAAAVEVEKAHATFMPLERERGRLASALDTLTARAAETKAMGKTVPKTLSAEIRKTRADLNAAEKAALDARTARDEAALKFEKAMADDPAQQAKSSVWAGLQRDLHRATAHVSNAANAFIQTPTGQNLGKFASWVHEQGKSAANAGYDNFVRTYRSLFMRQTPEGRWEHDLRKVTRAAGAAAGLAEAAHLWRSFGHDWWHSSKEERSKLKAPHMLAFKMADDAVTGAGYTTLVLQNRKSPEDATILWGERFDHAEDKPQKLYAGGRLGDVERRFQETRNRFRNSNGLGDGRGSVPSASTRRAPGFQNAKEETRNAVNQAIGRTKFQDISAGPAGDVQVRAESENDAAGNTFRNWVQRELLEKSQTQNARRAVFSSEGRLMSARDAYTILTGYKANGSGEKANHKGALGYEEKAFGSNDAGDIRDAMATIIDRSKNSLSKDPELRADFHRTIGIIGHVKKLPEDMIAGLHTKLTEESGGTVQHQGGHQHAEAPLPPMPSDYKIPTVAVHPLDGIPPHWNEAELKSAVGEFIAGPQGNNGLGGHLDQVTPAQREALQDLVSKLAVGAERYAQRTHGLKLPPREAVKLANRGIRAIAKGDKAQARAAVAASSEATFIHALHTKIDEYAEEEARKREFDQFKADLLDDIDGLMKVHLAKNWANEARDAIGQWTSGAAGQKILTEATDAGAEGAMLSSRKKRITPQGAGDQPWYHHSRLVNEAGPIAAGEVAYQLADKFLPRPAKLAPAALPTAGEGVMGMIQRIAPRVAQKLGYGAKVAARFGAVTGASMGAFSVAPLVAQAISPNYKPPGYKSVGEAHAETWGSTAGAMLPSATSMLAERGVLGAAAKNIIPRAVGGTFFRAGVAEGAATGAELGTAVGPMGTLGGALIGAGIGTVASYAGGKIARSLYNYAFQGYPKATADKIHQRAYGGSRQGAPA